MPHILCGLKAILISVKENILQNILLVYVNILQSSTVILPMKHLLANYDFFKLQIYQYRLILMKDTNKPCFFSECP